MELLLADFAGVMQTIGSVLLAILVLLIMITVHELGHYVAGKILKFGINEFAIGFGPAIFKRKTKSGEDFSIRVLPLGGFCSFKGEDEDNDAPDAFNNKKPWQRIIVLVSGALMNFVLALLIIMALFGIYGQSTYCVKQMNADTVYEQTLKEGDTLISIDGRNIYLGTDLVKPLQGKKAGDVVEIEVLRDGTRQKVDVKIRADANFANSTDVYGALEMLGTNVLSGANIRFNFFETIGRSFEYSFRLGGMIFTVLGELLTGKIGLSSMGGTVTTITMTAEAVRTGGLNFLLIIASYIGVNLAVFNLLPIPALDGSRVVFTVIEWIRKKPINRKVEGYIHFAGLVILMGFAILVDLLHLF